MQPRRYPTRTRVADAWIRRARDTRPSGGGSRIEQFLKEMGDTKVRSPKGEGEVTINTLHGSDDPKYNQLFQREYAKWSGGDDTTTEGRGARVIDSPQKLKTVQDELVEDAVNFGVPEATAREMVRGLVVGDDDSSVREVERNLQRAIDKAVGDKQRADADAAGKAERGKAEAQAEAERKQELQRRTQVRERAQAAESAADAARAALEEAKKSKDKAAIQRAEEAVNKAESKALSESAALTRVEVTEAGEAEAAATLKAQEAAAKAAAAAAGLEGAQAALEAARDAGDPDAIREAEEEAAAAQEAFDKADAEKRESEAALEGRRAEERKRNAEVAELQFEKAWAHAQKNRGVLLTDAEGNTVRYNPERSDEVYEYMMALLGEQVTKRGLPTMDTTSVRDIEQADDDGDGKEKGKGKGNKGDVKSKGDAPSGPTKSGKPRRPDGSSPTGGETEDYGPGEFWMVNPGKWSAKDSKGNHRTFGTMAGAKAYAKTASSMPSRVASRYLLGDGR